MAFERQPCILESMGRVKPPSDDDFRLPPSQPTATTRLTVLVNYRPVMDEQYRLDITLGPEWGTAYHLQHTLTSLCRAKQSFTLVDVDGGEWPFQPETVRVFWVKEGH